MRPFIKDTDFTLHVGDALDVLRELEPDSVDCVICSPPYWGLRDYGVPGQLGLEETPDIYITRMVDVFREVRRVLAPHGTCWVNLGDSYAANRSYQVSDSMHLAHDYGGSNTSEIPPGLKPKDLVGIPWRTALALQADGWWLRADIIWAKPNPMPESVTDRPTKAHEYVFLLTKQPRYWFDQEAVREPAVHGERFHGGYGKPGIINVTAARNGRHDADNRTTGRNIRSVWEIATQPYPSAHFATYPEELVRRCLLAGCPERVCRTCGKPSERIVEETAEYTAWKHRESGWSKRSGDLQMGRGTAGTGANSHNVPPKATTVGWTDCGHDNWRPGVVLDPFLGSGTTALVARNHERHCVGIELNPAYAAQAAKRLEQLSLLAGSV